MPWGMGLVCSLGVNFLTYEIDLQPVYLSNSFHCTNLVMQEISRTESQNLPPQDAPTPLALITSLYFHVIPQSSFYSLCSSPSLPFRLQLHLCLLISISLFPSLSLFFFLNTGSPSTRPGNGQDARCRVPSIKWQCHLVQMAQLVGESSRTPKRLQAQFQVRSDT